MDTKKAANMIIRLRQEGRTEEKINDFCGNSCTDCR